MGFLTVTCFNNQDSLSDESPSVTHHHFYEDFNTAAHTECHTGSVIFTVQNRMFYQVDARVKLALALNIFKCVLLLCLVHSHNKKNMWPYYIAYKKRLFFFHSLLIQDVFIYLLPNESLSLFITTMTPGIRARNKHCTIKIRGGRTPKLPLPACPT